MWANKNTVTLIDVSKEGGLEINEKTKCMLLSHNQNSGQNCDIKITNKSLENVAEYKYLRSKVTNQKDSARNYEELNSGNDY
jgi:hypothetical protein